MRLTLWVLPLLCVQDDAKDLWDFKPGTEWMYDIKEGDKKKKSVMTVKEKKDGRVFLESKEYEGGSPEATKTETSIACAKDGFIVWSRMQDGKEVELFRLLKIGSTKGDTWKSRFGGSPEFEMENAGPVTFTAAGTEREGIRVVMKLTGEKGEPVGTIDFTLVRGIGIAKAEFKAGGVTAFLMELKEHFPVK